MVDKELFQRYEVALLACTDLGRMQVEALVKSLDGLTPQQQAARLMLEYPRLLQNYGQAAAQATVQWYQEARDAHFEEVEDADYYEAQAATPIQDSWAYEDLQEAAKTGMAHLPGMAVNRIMQRADRTMAYNVARDPSHPCWAIVPNFGACGFCVMIGSNGFYMKRQPVKVQRHDHCRCTVVADWDTKNPHLDGYDPDALYRAYKEAEESTRAYVDYAWSRMSDEEQEKYKRKGRSAKDVFKTKVISKEIKRRDPSWVQDGKSCRLSKETGAKPMQKELEVGMHLRSHGFFVDFMREANRTGVKTADARLNGEVWEFKIPEGWNGEHTIRNQFFKARDKGTTRLLISATKNGAGLDEMTKWVIATFDKGDYEFISEVMLISADGKTVARIQREMKGAQTPVT